MEQAKKNLKISSWLVLLFTLAFFVQIITELMIGDINSAQIPEGAPDNILLITKTILLVVALVMMIPKLYVGIKGLRLAKNPKPAKAHIVWAGIILVFTVLGLFDPLMAIFEQGDLGGEIVTLCNVLVDAWVYFEYIRNAKALAKLVD